MLKYDKDALMKLYEQAEAEKFAIPSFNYSDIWDMRAIVEAAEEMHAPVLLMSDPPVFEEIGHRMCSAMVDVLQEEASVPVIHHLDHSSDIADCKDAIDLGFKSVMMDASHLPIEGNIKMVREITKYANANGCFVEAEIGRIRGESAYETSYTGDDYLFDLNEAVKLVEEGKPNSLAIGIGNAHGFYQGKPELNFRKLAEAKEAISVPLVLHGGTGIPEEDIQKAIREGIRKVNVGTAIYTSYMNGIREKLIRDGENQWTFDVMQAGTDRVKAVVKQWIRMCMAENRI